MKIRILYVDDEPINLQLFQINFKERYDILLAPNGKEGLQIMEENSYIKLVFSDMKMPYMNGLEFIKQASDKYPEIPFFIISGFEKTPEINEAQKSGLIKKYLAKPFVINEIESSIKEFCTS